MIVKKVWNRMENITYTENRINFYNIFKQLLTECNIEFTEKVLNISIEYMNIKEGSEMNIKPFIPNHKSSPTSFLGHDKNYCSITNSNNANSGSPIEYDTYIVFNMGTVSIALATLSKYDKNYAATTFFIEQKEDKWSRSEFKGARIIINSFHNSVSYGDFLSSNYPVYMERIKNDKTNIIIIRNKDLPGPIVMGDLSIEGSTSKLMLPMGILSEPVIYNTSKTILASNLNNELVNESGVDNEGNVLGYDVITGIRLEGSVGVLEDIIAISKTVNCGEEYLLNGTAYEGLNFWYGNSVINNYNFRSKTLIRLE